MLLRRNILPRSLADAAVIVFMVVIIPVVYWFELFVVVPTYHKPWTLWYTLHFFAGSFIMLNVTSNYIAILLCDTSIRGRILPANLDSRCRFCSVCESIVPPRSWHCNVCDVCILKRDHHCMFTGCCVGHYNLRYFLMFTMYIFIACIYATYYNTFFISKFVEFSNWMSIVKVIFPLAMMVVHFDQNQSFLLLYLIVVIGSMFTGVLTFYHVDLMLKGKVTHERNQQESCYSLGKWRNLREVLGDRWYLVWVSPFIHSELPQDGIHWKVRETVKSK